MGWPSEGWSSSLQSPGARKVALATVNIFGLPPADPHRHLALEPGSFCVASHPGVNVTHATSTRTVPFWPLLGAWPAIQRRYWPHERRAEISAVDLDILAEAGLTSALLDQGGGQGATGRVDLWTDGIDLADVQPLLAGHVVGTPSLPRRTGGTGVRIADGDPDKTAMLPPGPITRAEWPDAPEDVAGIVQRTIIVGPFPERVPCAQIDATGRQWYVCDPACSVQPQRCWVNGVEQRTGWTAERAETPSGLSYSRIVFAQPASQLGAAPVSVDCGSGIGLREDGAIPLLLSLGGYALTARASALLDVLRRQFDLSVLLNAQGDVWQIVRDRLGAQTPYVLTQHLGAVDVLDAYGTTPTWTVGVGTGLIGRMDAADTETDTDAVVNALEVACGRDAAAGVPLARVYRDATHGPAASRTRCHKSQTLYGRRYKRLDAADLTVEYDAFGRVVGSAAGERLADAMLNRHCFPWRALSYLADWWPGVLFEPGDCIRLTDAVEGYVDAPGLVGGVTIGAAGPEVVLYVEAAPTRPPVVVGA